MKKYNNYHKHDHYSNIRTSDVIVKPKDYIKRAKELGHNTYFTTNHGNGGNVYQAYELCQKENIKCIFGVEAYYVDNRLDYYDKESNKTIKDRSNYHIILIALNIDGYKDINRIISEANSTGFYYHPRIDLELLLSLNPNNIVVTTACVKNRIYKGILKNENVVNSFINPVKNHFKNNFFLEVQSHNEEIQKKWNNIILKLANKFNIQIIHANDSHYIYPEQSKDREQYIKGKGISYDNEDTFILDYPDYDTIVSRYKEQGVLSEFQIKNALNNTLIFDKCMDLGFNKDIKMPTIYQKSTIDERYNILKDIVINKLKEKIKDIPVEKAKKYIEATQFELDIIKETNIPEVRSADYFLINKEIIQRGIQYGGILTQTGRGSAVSFLVNHLLGFTEVDRLDAEVPLYPTRFMSKSRLLETKSLPDIDFNVAQPEPFIKASKDILGEDNCCYMIAFGTLKKSGAFRVMCRAYGYEMDEYNSFAKRVGEIEKIKDKEEAELKYNELKNEKIFGKILEESEKFVDVIDSASPSPCSFLLLDKPISSEIGLMRINEEICCMIDGYTADVWKFLKNDILTVSVWDIISKCYKELNEPIPSISKLRKKLDKNVWDLYKNGITKTLNQVDSKFATPLVSKYAPKNAGELTAFVAAIRPSFSSLLNGFINRDIYTTNVPELDKLLKDSFHYLLYQENIMQYLTWLGIEEDQTYSLIKKISKKVLTEKELWDLSKILRRNWIKHIGDDKQFEETWQVIKDSAKYGFNASHANSVAWDSLYGAELKAHHPLIYYTVVFNKYSNDVEKIAEITHELEYFGIQQKSIVFRKSRAYYSYNKEENSIYKGIASLKYLNEIVSEELYSLRNNKYNSFLDLLIDINTKTTLDARQLNILIILDFFSEFGKSKKLLQITEYYNNLYSRKQIKKDDIHKLNIPMHLLYKYANKETEKLFKEIRMQDLIIELAKNIENKSLSLKERLLAEIEYMGYIDFTFPNVNKNIYFITEFKDYSKKGKPYLKLYRIKDGEIISAKITKAMLFNEKPFKEHNIIVVDSMSEAHKKRLVDGVWEKTGEFWNVIDSYSVY